MPFNQDFNNLVAARKDDASAIDAFEVCAG
jgi:hypothetical protein